MRFIFARLGDAKDHIITAILLVLAISLLVIRYDGGLQTIRTGAVVIISYLEQPLSNIRIYRQALQTNRDLRRENVLLLDELSKLRTIHEENRQLRLLLNMKDTLNAQWPLVPVTIIGKNLTGLNNSLTIDAGRKLGVETGMPVVNSNGLIGKVITVSENFAQVMPINNSLFRASAIIQNTRAYGIVSWEGERINELVLNYVPQTAVVEKGMIVQTSGLSNFFPPNIPIGEITRYVPEPGRETQRIFIMPFVNLNEVSEGFVMMFQPVVEIDTLQRKFDEIF